MYLNIYNKNNLDCRSTLNISWADENIDHIEGNYEVLCNNKINFNITFYGEKIDISEEETKIARYSYIVTFLAILQLMNSFWMTKKLGDSQSIAHSVKKLFI